jgi:transcriptional regulator with XRE-family HTH domain
LWREQPLSVGARARSGDKTVVTVRQIKAARALADWSQRDLSGASGVSLPTISKLERDEGPLGGRESTRTKILAAFKRIGIVFLNIEEQGVTLRGIRRRARAGQVRLHKKEVPHRGRPPSKI